MADQEETNWSGLPIVCPHCGNHGDADGPWKTNASSPFKLIEEVVRSFVLDAEIDGSGTLFLRADVESDEVDWESGTNLRIECMQCFGEFAIPEGADVDFD